MNFRIFFLSLAVFIFSRSISQVLSGSVIDDQEAPLVGVTVALPALHLGTVTDTLGNFSIGRIPDGIYTVEFILVGYKKEARSVTIAGEATKLTIMLRQSPLQLQGVIVTGKPQPTDAIMSQQSVSTMQGRELELHRGQSIMQSIETVPGVSTYTTGAGIVKPVIRGLTSQRVVVLADNIRQEGQQWGDEHGAEIDAFDVERIEVLRGPSSILYGSDALGGVVNIIRHDIPSSDEGAPQLGGSLDLNGFSNNRAGAGALSFLGANGVLGYRAYVSLRDAGDISTPTGRLFNSGIREANGGAKIGVHGEWGAATLDYTRFDQELQIHEDPVEDPEATPFQKIIHDRVHAHGDFSISPFRFEVDGSWQKNTRREFEERNATEPVLRLELSTTSLEIKGHHQPIGNVFGTLGFSLMSQKNKSMAEEKLIPGFESLNLAGFVYEEAVLGDVNASAGLRFDGRTLDISETPELGVTGQNLSYGALTGAVGLVWRIVEPFALAMNVGRAWRAPTAFELFVNGVHEGTVRYEVGDRNLKNESSLNADISARYASDKIQAELTFFRNVIDNYVFLSPTGSIDSASGFPVYLHKQADATLLGGEFSLQAQVTSWLILNGGVDYVHARNSITNKPLPLIPANRVKFGAKVTGQSLGLLLSPYFTFSVRVVADQKRVDEFETATGGYTLLDLAAGGSIALGESRLNVDFVIENVFDRAYRDHLNRYKSYALNMGRNVELKLSVPFILVQ